MSSAFSIAGIALSVAACSVARGATPTATTTVPTATVVPRGSYAALGDSYTAGPDIPDQAGTTAGCQQSSSSYPYLVAQSLRLDLTDMSCGGATIASLSAPQPTGDGTIPAQLSALSAATALVTLGIGGNDVDWSGIVTRCTELDLVPALIPGGIAPEVTPCQDYYDSGGTDQIRQKIRALAGHLAGALTQIGHRAPHARVYVVGYPDLLPGTGDTRRLEATACASSSDPRRRPRWASSWPSGWPSAGSLGPGQLGDPVRDLGPVLVFLASEGRGSSPGSCCRSAAACSCWGPRRPPGPAVYRRECVDIEGPGDPPRGRLLI